jgi:RNA polymerase sigma-70 factor (TIGR02957 family)
MTAGAVAEFEAQRGRLFGLAYRLLGSAADAEDIVQDAFLRWHGADRAAIGSPPAWLAKIVTNLCLNQLASARAQRVRYTGPWLPEPVLTEDGALGPLGTAAQRESVSLALLVLLERLTPPERAVFVLHEAFGYPYAEIAGLLDLSEPNCRQLHRRARQRLADGRARFQPPPANWRELVQKFLVAAGAGDLPGLQKLLAADVTAWTDGGGKVSTARRPVYGPDRVARYLAGLLHRYAAGIQVTLAEVNGAPAILVRQHGELTGVLVAEFSGGQLSALRGVANPDKLRFAARQAADLSR